MNIQPLHLHFDKFGTESSLLAICTSPTIHLICTKKNPPPTKKKKLIAQALSFLSLGTTVMPRRNKKKKVYYWRCANGESQILILFFWFVVYLNQTIWLKPVGHTSPSPSAPLTLEITISCNFLRVLLLVKKFHICWLECKVK